MTSRLALLAFAASLGLVTAAQAHTHLVSAIPAANAAGAAPAKVQLTFSERLEPKFSSAKLSLGGAPVAATSAASGKALVATPAKPLRAGLYTVDWSVLAADGHKMSGAYRFTVR